MMGKIPLHSLFIPPTIEDLYKKACAVPSNINEHLPTLQYYAGMCDSVAEFSSQHESMYGLLMGLARRPTTYLRVSTSVVSAPKVPLVVCEQLQSNSAKPCLSKPVDLLFINSWHIYGHLKRELANNAHLVRKYIIMHNTVVDAVKGESVRCGMNTEEQSSLSGYPEIEIRHGLGLAIKEFLCSSPEWEVAEKLDNNHGLTVLAKI